MGMNTQMGFLLGISLAAWTALAADNRIGEPDSIGGRTPAFGPAATRPADGPASVPPLRGLRSQEEGTPRRDASPAGPAGRRPGATLRGPLAFEEPLSPEQVDQLMLFVRDNFPQIHDRLHRLRRVDPAAFQQIVRRLARRFQAILDTQKRDPDLARVMIEEQRLELGISELARKFHQARVEPEKMRIRNALRDLLRQRFDRRQERARREIENLRKRLDEQARRISERDQNRERILRGEMQRTLQGVPPGGLQGEQGGN